MSAIRRRGTRVALTAVALVIVLAAAWAVQRVSPGEAGWQDPIPVDGRIGEPVAGRNIEVEVRAVRVAETIAARGWTGETPGLWVLVDLSAQAVVDDAGALLGHARLVADGVSFGSSERVVADSLHRTRLDPGIARTGTLAFEISREVLDAQDAHLEFAVSADPRLDSLLRIPFDLAELEVEAGEPVELEPIVEEAP